MGWEIKNNQFFCNTSDTFFGPYLEDWPDHDSWCPSERDRLFHRTFNQFLSNNPQKRRGSLETDPRSMTEKHLEKIVGEFEELWNSLERASETMVSFAKENQLNTVEVLNHLAGDELDYTPKKKKKAAKKKAVKKKAVKKRGRWERSI